MRPLRFLLIICVFFTVVWLIIFAQKKNVERKAVALADGQPYCIQVPEDDAEGAEYREARSWKDLTVFGMHGYGPIHHAILVVGKPETGEMYHWSYWQQDYIKGTYGRQPIYCKPRTNFIPTLETTSSKKENIDFYLAGQHFIIPKVYHPAPLWADGYGISFSAKAPLFEPLTQSSPPTDFIHNSIYISFRHTQRMQVWLQVADQYHIIEPYGDTYGLKKQIVKSVDKSVPRVQYFLTTTDGNVMTLIDCSSSSDNVLCLHLFEYNGWYYQFNQMSNDIVHWQAMQRRLVALTNSFCVSN